jgi:hypothetical protein
MQDLKIFKERTVIEILRQVVGLIPSKCLSDARIPQFLTCIHHGKSDFATESHFEIAEPRKILPASFLKNLTPSFTSLLTSRAKFANPTFILAASIFRPFDLRLVSEHSSRLFSSGCLQRDSECSFPLRISFATQHPKS